VTKSPPTTADRHDDRVAENPPPDQPADEPTPPTGLPALPPPATPEPLPPGMNADEYREFQEFQRFRQYRQYVEATGQTHSAELERQFAQLHQRLARIDSAVNPPVWRKVLRSGWLHRIVWLVVVALIAIFGIPLLIEHLFGSHNPTTPGSDLPPPSKEQKVGQLPDGAHEAVYDVYMWVADNDSFDACNAFNSTTKADFVRAVGALDCQHAIDALHNQVSDPTDYGNPNLRDLPAPAGSTMTISSCDFTVTGGPRLGTFTVTHVETGWEITGYRAQQPCPSTVPTT
jgi:hypothetical protein